MSRFALLFIPSILCIDHPFFASWTIFSTKWHQHWIRGQNSPGPVSDPIRQDRLCTCVPWVVSNLLSLLLAPYGHTPKQRPHRGSRYGLILLSWPYALDQEPCQPWQGQWVVSRPGCPLSQLEPTDFIHPHRLLLKNVVLMDMDLRLSRTSLQQSHALWQVLAACTSLESFMVANIPFILESWSICCSLWSH